MSEQAKLVKLVQEAIDLCEEASAAIQARDKSLDKLRSIVGGDRLAAIRNAQVRIGQLLTEPDARP